MATKEEILEAIIDVAGLEAIVLGPAPTFDEALAYFRGELSPEAEARMRDRVVWYPDLVLTLLAEFEPDDDDDPVMTDEEIAEDVAKIRAKIAALNVEREIVDSSAAGESDDSHAGLVDDDHT